MVLVDSMSVLEHSKLVLELGSKLELELDNKLVLELGSMSELGQVHSKWVQVHSKWVLVHSNRSLPCGIRTSQLR